MASTATTVPSPSNNSETVEERRPQAGPLPRKCGEIGYQGSVGNEGVSGNDEIMPLPPRHPADREPEATPMPEAEEAASTSDPATSRLPSSPISSDADTYSLQKPPKRTGLFSWLDPRPILKRKRLGGIRPGTVLRLSFQVILLAGTIALWVVVARVLAVSHSNGGSAADSPTDQPPNPEPILGGSAAIFLHISFGVVTLVELLFLERCIFFVRAQRYAYKHHGAALPTHRSRNGSSAGVGSLAMSLAPWNRPPLPTYAAALAQSGVGTGDVEDNLIAMPPPPAYGHTRGSTLLLAGFMRNSLRATIPQDPPSSRPASRTSRRSRPVSYVSHDEEWEQRRDAERALRLSETLGRLEENSAQQPPGASQNR